MSSTPSQAAREAKCTCAEVIAEDPNCAMHGELSSWAEENYTGSEWQEVVQAYREAIAQHKQSEQSIRADERAKVVREAVNAAEISAAKWFAKAEKRRIQGSSNAANIHGRGTGAKAVAQALAKLETPNDD